MKGVCLRTLESTWRPCCARRSSPKRRRAHDRRQKDDPRGPMGPTDGAALAGHHATPDRAPVSLARQNSEAVTGACTMTKGRLSGRLFCEGRSLYESKSCAVSPHVRTLRDVLLAEEGRSIPLDGRLELFLRHRTRR